MKTEFEAKFLRVDADGLRRKLKSRGAVLAKAGFFQTRAIFENDRTKLDGSWVRLRREYGKVTLALKLVSDSARIEGTNEVEVDVSDFSATESFLLSIGMRRVRYQENHREEWRLNGVIYDFDTWPGLPTLLEIESDHAEAVRSASENPGLDYGTARFGSVDDIYLSETGRDTLKEREPLFSAEEKERLSGRSS